MCHKRGRGRVLALGSRMASLKTRQGVSAVGNPMMGGHGGGPGRDAGGAQPVFGLQWRGETVWVGGCGCVGSAWGGGGAVEPG